ncbi:hypothetical protein [Chryseobacterium sp. WLY505]|uniref:hypothetical protein n=1 Tax=Chryseobacterium sp. WLY505 TaxID=3068892 RepID=UPI0027965E6C|nr:hypothetical protein [Chryseobacterium sp. WLY505]MDQ1855782.1 hypothetical protein [Chryseobacterium sp. WLY505]
MKTKFSISLVLILTIQTISAQIKTFSYNMVQIVKNMNVTELATRKTKIVIDKKKNTISTIDSEFATPYIYKIEGSCDILMQSIFCTVRDNQNRLIFFSYNKNRLEIMDLSGNGTRYINIK